MKEMGIEKIRVYPTSLQLDLEKLALARGYDPDYMHRELMVERRGINPLWEDPVTMAVNAAKPMLSPEDIESIGLLVVASETGLDLEKSLSSWVFHHLGLPSSCRHFEIKIACYAGTAALRTAISWLSSPFARNGQKALVITTDESLISLHKPWEYNSGGGAVAMLISERPQFVSFEEGKSGIYAHDVTDVIRPLPWIESANNEISLYSYMEALANAYEAYEANGGPIDFLSHFNYCVYHVPFSGISFRAHKQLMSIHTEASRREIREDFERRVLPSISYTSKIGATYGGSIFIALLGLIDSVAVKPGERIGIYSYGSGSCAEFYSALVGEQTRETARAAGLRDLLERRIEISVEQYERLEKERVEVRRSSDCHVDLDGLEGLYESLYEGKGLLVYKGSTEYCRSYELS